MADTFVCRFCGHSESAEFSECPACCIPQSGPAPQTQKKSVSKAKAAASAPANNPRGADPSAPLEPVCDGAGCVIGIDPGARFTGVAVIDADTNLLASWIFVRPQDQNDMQEWLKELLAILDTTVLPLFPGAMIGVEKVSEPKGYHKGVVAAMNPKDIMWTALLVGGMTVHYKNAVFIKPANNGSQDDDYYPDELKGRRPPTLIGSNNKAGTRKHEKSAYDVAKKALDIHLNP